jgi:hypothetical protein
MPAIETATRYSHRGVSATIRALEKELDATLFRALLAAGVPH